MLILMALTTIFILDGCATKERIIIKKCDLPPHTKPLPMDANATNAEFLIYLRNLLAEYEILLRDYEACRD